MRAIIIGGGKVGYYIFKTLQGNKYDITLIEQDRDLCDKIAEEIDGDIICGDGTNLEVLEEANIQNAEIVAAVTGKDEENLVICQMAKISFNVSKTIARINNPKNRPIFKVLGVDRTVCSTEVIANLIEGEFANEKLKTVQTFEMGGMILVETCISKEDKGCGKRICDLKLPSECVITSIVRDSEVVFPKGEVKLKANDKLLMITNCTKKIDVQNAIIGR